MNKYLKGILAIGVCGTMLLGAAGCKTPDGPDPTDDPTEKKYDTETRALQLATGALDENFNPFFYTAQNDGNMIANTQIAMLTIDENGKLVAGQNQPTVVLDYRETRYNDYNGGAVIPDTDTSTEVKRTEYEFVIKNGIKFSDGKELSIVDVLFNLYVYLDPAYTGSSTIYSTNIQGLKAYRSQEAGRGDFDDADTDARFRGEAWERIQTLIDWSTGKSEYDITGNKQAEADRDTTYAEFKKEITSDWNNIYSSWAESYKEDRVNSAWQAYLLSEGLVQYQYQYNANGSRSKIKDADGKNYTTLDPWQAGNTEGGNAEDIGAEGWIEEIEAATTEDGKRDAAINIVYNNYANRQGIGGILTYWQTASVILEQFTNEQRAIYFQQKKESGEGVSKISGINTYSTSGSNLSELDWKIGETFTSDESYDVLKIAINGVDPKAIYNFAFTVAPLHYYSGEWTNSKTNVTKDYVAEAKAYYNTPDKDGNYHFGVEIGDPDFMTFMQKMERTGAPLGAGPYAAANSTGGYTNVKGEFCNNGVCHFIRNTYFETVGTGLNNAKIKYIDYKVAADDQLMSNLTTQAIDFAMPNATSENVATVNSSTFLDGKHYTTGGYGYVGINPKFVPEYKVRQAIMKTFDSMQTVKFYGTDLAEVIYRPMTKTSWVYDYEVNYQKENPIDEEYPSIAYYEDIEEVKQLVKEAGYELKNGVYTKTRQMNGMSNAKDGTTLKFTFTIAGDATDHPAYIMFLESAKVLNDIGFDISIARNPNALKDLATGNLAIWAAAWSSSIDPDPYQVYHKDSGATSVLNWNYKNILNDAATWDYEYNIIQDLSDLIDDGRATTNENIRAKIYGQCLDLIMDLAVEFPTYQRHDLCVYNKTVIDANSLVKNPSYNMGLFDRLWEIDYV